MWVECARLAFPSSEEGKELQHISDVHRVVEFGILVICWSEAIVWYGYRTSCCLHQISSGLFMIAFILAKITENSDKECRDENDDRASYDFQAPPCMKQITEDFSVDSSGL